MAAAASWLHECAVNKIVIQRFTCDLVTFCFELMWKNFESVLRSEVSGCWLDGKIQEPTAASLCTVLLFVLVLNKISPPKADKYPKPHFAPFNCCLTVVLSLEKKGLTPEIRRLCFVIINCVLFNLAFFLTFYESLSWSVWRARDVSFYKVRQPFTIIVLSLICQPDSWGH